MVRFFYFILWVTMNYVLRIYFKTIKVINGPKEFYGRTIYVSNHASAFMDPLVAGALRRPIVFFMTRSDIFNSISRPFLWAAHMLPIYRQHDGEDTKSKNEKVFNECAKILKYGRNLLIFSEGFTDDKFIRRLKPIKKGAVRIGFNTLEKYNWQFNVNVAAIGINYTDPNQLRSEVLISNSNKICLNDYKERYLENPNKVINELTKLMEGLMQEQITHIQNKDFSELHENVMAITGKGMHPTQTDFTIPLQERWNYSKKLAEFINQNERVFQSTDLGERLKIHHIKAEKTGVLWSDIQNLLKGKSIDYLLDLFLLVFLLPVVILNLIHSYFPYLFIKKWVEKSFKRKVFWGSVKLLLGMIIIGLLNIPIVYFLTNYFGVSYWWGFTYYLCLGPFFLGHIYWKKAWFNFQRKKFLTQEIVKTVAASQQNLQKEIRTLIPFA
ncbi:MAG: 1-acyl-sn-glycerol-3-phosphate acyltransferase [Bacteroidetes bacterium]|nr:1-acyl-sn-glycerol-3-phosphate acyltransferase [Bacteroidota bacterium]